MSADTRNINTNYRKSNIDCECCLFSLTQPSPAVCFNKTIFGRVAICASIDLYVYRASSHFDHFKYTRPFVMRAFNSQSIRTKTMQNGQWIIAVAISPLANEFPEYCVDFEFSKHRNNAKVHLDWMAPLFERKSIFTYGGLSRREGAMRPLFVDTSYSHWMRIRVCWQLMKVHIVCKHFWTNDDGYNSSRSSRYAQQ